MVSLLWASFSSKGLERFLFLLLAKQASKQAGGHANMLLTVGMM